MSMEAQMEMGLGEKGKVSQDFLLGQIARFLDCNYASTESIKPVLSQHPVMARLCRNESGSTLSPGFIVRGDATADYGPLKAAAGVAANASDQVPIGVVDPWITGTVADNEFFWLLYYGPGRLRFTTGTTLDEGSLLELGAAGRAALYGTVGTPDARSNLYRVGRSLEAVDTAIVDDTLFRAFINIQF